MSNSNPQHEDYGDIWPKVYRVIALIILIPIFLYLGSLLITALGILLKFIFVLVLLIVLGFCVSVVMRFLFG